MWNSTRYFNYLFPGNSDLRDEKVWILGSCVNFLEIYVKTRIFVEKTRTKIKTKTKNKIKIRKTKTKTKQNKKQNRTNKTKKTGSLRLHLNL